MTESLAVRIISGARKHGISRRRIEHALLSQTEAEAIEMVAVVLPGLLLIIHAMPTRYRRKPL